VVITHYHKVVLLIQVAAENDVSLRDHCAELETVISNLHRELDVQVAEHSSRLADHVAASQHSAEQAEQHISQLMADIDDLRAQLKACGFLFFFSKLHQMHELSTVTTNVSEVWSVCLSVCNAPVSCRSHRTDLAYVWGGDS